MAIQQNRRQSDLEKRLQLLRRQVYGKEESKETTVYRLPSAAQPTVAGLTEGNRSRKSAVLISDINYLHQDLLKILIFSSFAIGIQILLYWALRNHLIKLFL